MKIEVTQKHIDYGKRWSTKSCPVALAIAEATGSRVRISPYRNIVHAMRQVLNIPEEATRFMDKFDVGLPVEPMTFELRVYENGRLSDG